MACTIPDATVRMILELGVFANYAEYHAFEMGLLLPIVCIFIGYFDKRIAAVALSISMLGGLGVIPLSTVAPAVMEKPWYFISGLVISCAVLTSILEVVKTDKIDLTSSVKQVFVR